MKIKAIVSMLVLSLLAFVGFALANTGLQTTPYSNSYFSATFNAPVSVDSPARNGSNTSTDYAVYSNTPTVGQIVTARVIDHDIPVDQSSSDFYANDDTTGGTITNRSVNTYQGHPFTYTRRIYTEDGVRLSKRTRYIIVNSREVIFIVEIAPIGVAGDAGDLAEQQQWFDFEDSLNIK